MAQIQSAYNSGTTPVTITLAAGSYSWTTTFFPTATKGVTLTCATAPPAVSPWGAAETGGCNITSSTRVFQAFEDYNLSAGVVTVLYQITGMNFVSIPDDGFGSIAWLTCNCTLQQFRVAHNSFLGPGTFVHVGGSDAGTKTYANGVIDHNKGRATNLFHLLDGNVNEDATTYPTEQRGTSNNIFIEDNDVRFTADITSVSVTDWQGPGGIVLRSNYFSQGRPILHGVQHGGGPSNWEIYWNTIVVVDNDCFGCINHQGSGEGYAFGNSFSSNLTLNEALRWQHYRSVPQGGSLGQCDGLNSSDGNRTPIGTYRGYPCYHQPGRNFSAVLKPMYFWGNTNASNGARVGLTFTSNGGSPDYFSNHIQADREYYDSVSVNANNSPTSPFNGTTGMGFGTLANRPTTCSVGNTDAADITLGVSAGGVGYFATDQGSWNTSGNGRGSGVLYRCTGSNNWVAHYTPYTYPHPLVGGAAPSTPSRFNLNLNLRRAAYDLYQSIVDWFAPTGPAHLVRADHAGD